MQSERRPLLVVQGRPIRYSGQSFHLDIAPELGNLAARQSGGIRVIRYITLFGWFGEIVTSSECISVGERPSGRKVFCVGGEATLYEMRPNDGLV